VPLLQQLTGDNAEFTLYQEDRLNTRTVASVAQEALQHYHST
jgi:hypothetical protein